jgi:ribose 5-phosphate isomerase A
MDKEKAKRLAAEAALHYVDDNTIIGVGTGSTVAYFIQALQSKRQMIEGAVASSIDTAQRLKIIGIPILDLNAASQISLYVDGADEINPAKQMIKGGGGASTREKIIASVAKKFVCIVDESKCVGLLGTFPVAVEVLPMARSFVAREIVRLLGADPVYREGVVTDNGNVILDVYGLRLLEPRLVEEQLKNMVGVVESGLFAKRKADIVLVGSGSSDNVKTIG